MAPTMSTSTSKKGTQPVTQRQGRKLKRVKPSLPKGLCCLNCRERRVRCDGVYPCQSCLRKARWDGRNMDTNHGCVFDKHLSSSATAMAGDQATGVSLTTTAPARAIDSLNPSPSSSSSGSAPTAVSTTNTPLFTLLPENTMDAFAIACQQRLDNNLGFVSAAVGAVRAPKSSQISSKSKSSSAAPVADKGPLLKGLACLSCKARRVKCDGQRPACSSCVRNARWESRRDASSSTAVENVHGCVYRADLPQKLAPLPAGYVAPPPLLPKSEFGRVDMPIEVLKVLPVEDGGATPKAMDGMLLEKRVKVEECELDTKSSLAALASAGPQPEGERPRAHPLYPFRHAPESPRSLPSLSSSTTVTTASISTPVSTPASISFSAFPSPLPSPLQSPHIHGTPHAFYGHDLLPVSYPPVPYPPADIWDSIVVGEELRLPGPASASSFDQQKETSTHHYGHPFQVSARQSGPGQMFDDATHGQQRATSSSSYSYFDPLPAHHNPPIGFNFNHSDNPNPLKRGAQDGWLTLSGSGGGGDGPRSSAHNDDDFDLDSDAGWSFAAPSSRTTLSNVSGISGWDRGRQGGMYATGAGAMTAASSLGLDFGLGELDVGSKPSSLSSDLELDKVQEEQRNRLGALAEGGEGGLDGSAVDVEAEDENEGWPDCKRQRKEDLRTTTSCIGHPLLLSTVLDDDDDVKGEHSGQDERVVAPPPTLATLEPWQVSLGECLSAEVTSGWGL